MATEYQVLARKYRPQTFSTVVGQEAIVLTLKNAVKYGKLSHAYLFCGPRGTGKTTTARLLAKVINCHNRSADCEPCNACPSCKEITIGNSLDVLEIDGASHRGIDDIRKINETVGYATAHGGYKIYIIDEVHMLTKEAFNALLKTLEEPPPRVKFFFATTEVHKVPATILSRCQRFNLGRIPLEKIVLKLRQITDEMGVAIEDDALHLIANRAEGGLRDAESILDQITAYQDKKILLEDVQAIFGLMPRDTLFRLDEAGHAGNLALSFEIAEEIYLEGKDIPYFIEMLTEHIRYLLQCKLTNQPHLPASLSPEEQARYIKSATLYSRAQCLELLDYLIDAQQKIRFAPSGRIALENILLHLLRSHQQISVEELVTRLTSLEERITQRPLPTPTPAPKPPVTAVTPTPIPTPKPPIAATTPTPIPTPKPPIATPPPAPIPVKSDSTTKLPAPIELGARPTEEAKAISFEQKAKHETLMQFAAVELEGVVKLARLPS